MQTNDKIVDTKRSKFCLGEDKNMLSIKVLAGSTHPNLSKKVAQKLGIKFGSCLHTIFQDNETNVEILESVRQINAIKQ